MKIRESGMPERVCWDRFFDVECMLQKLFGPGPVQGDVLEFGCGYGTFTLPAARHVQGSLRTLDIEAGLVARVEESARLQGLGNISAGVRDFIVKGSGVDDKSQSHVMIYNLLHLEDPIALLAEAYRVLQPAGRLSIIHWRSDISTPRGPPLDIRPTPEQCREWLLTSGFNAVQQVDLTACCDFHFGFISSRPM